MPTHDESDLIVAERHVAEGEARIERLQVLIERFEQTGNLEAVTGIRDTVAILSQTLALMRSHRDQIRRDVTGQAHDQRGVSHQDD